MSKKKKSLCDWDKKEIEKNLTFLADIISDSKFICRKCARSASSKIYLCKPVDIAN